MTILELLWGIFAVLSLMDAVLTYKVITQKKGKEVNPFMAGLFTFFGLVPTLLISKVAVISIVWYTLNETSLYVLPPIIAAYIWVVLNNYRVYRE